MNRGLIIGLIPHLLFLSGICTFALSKNSRWGLAGGPRLPLRVCARAVHSLVCVCVCMRLMIVIVTRHEFQLILRAITKRTSAKEMVAKARNGAATCPGVDEIVGSL